MTSLLRQIVAGPRAKHQETGLDLCYVTSDIIATSGPSQTYPQRAYRNPLDRLVAFLDAKHKDGWAIWEFRAEGTGYPDEAVYNRIRHYPWPDHHPPPFRLVPMIMASMRNWLNGTDLDAGGSGSAGGEGKKDDSTTGAAGDGAEEKAAAKAKNGRVIVVHCKAGKGRSGTMACSFLISERNWKPEDALARFTERRMRKNFGAGVSIPSQLRTISYVDRWARTGKKYVDREVEVVEVHVWGLRHGVKVSVEGYVEEGKKIKVFHTFTADERYVVEGEAPGGNGVIDLVSDMAGYRVEEDDNEEIVEDADYGEIKSGPGKTDSDASLDQNGNGSPSPGPARSKSKKMRNAKTTGLIRRLSKSSSSLNKLSNGEKSKTISMADHSSSISSSASNLPAADAPQSASQASLGIKPRPTLADSSEPGGMAVIFKPAQPVRIPNSDVNLSVERRNRAPASMGLTMVTAVAHVWFNTYFEGNGPEQGGRPDDSGVFEIDWDKMDGIKGSSRKGTRACDRVAIVWRAVGAGARDKEAVGESPGAVIDQPGIDSPVPQMQAADWKGGNKEDPESGKRLGLRAEDPSSANVSKASSVKSQETGGDAGGHAGGAGADDADDESLQGVKVSGPAGEEVLAPPSAPATPAPAGVNEPSKSSDELGEQRREENADATAKKGFIVE